ncbi:MAG: ribonuclease H-like domain-containing protein [Candidatus Helarchaeota archaeon]
MYKRHIKKYKRMLRKDSSYTNRNGHESSPKLPDNININYINKDEELEKLLGMYEGYKFRDIYQKIIETKTDYGVSFYIERDIEIRPITQHIRDSIEFCKKHLKLVRGIREKTENRLKDKRINSIEDLLHNNIYYEDAKRIMDCIDGREYKILENILRNRLGKSNFQNMILSGFISEENLIFLDIETLGLMGAPIIMIGIGHKKTDNFCIKQYLVRDPSEEYAVLLEILNLLVSNNAIISYNGRSFDIPMIRSRLSFFDIEYEFNNTHFDLYWYSRDAFPNLPDYKLETLENKILNIERSIDLDSSIIPHYYDVFRSTDNIGPIIPIIEHNFIDVVSLIDLFSQLNIKMRDIIEKNY